MEKYEILNRALYPVGKAMDVSLGALRKANLYEPFKKGLYESMRVALSSQFKLNNKLKVFGAENIPAEGGVVLAMNHQSWLDVQVVAASCPRKICWLAKSEFASWPILKQMIEIADGIFIRRGGDAEMLQVAVSRLKEGACIGIFPEGTIPGEEDIPRWDVEPETGLLRGKTGAVRLALMANVPIVPVGLSGTGRSFPPEAYPRLQMAPIQRPTPIEVRFGEPIRFRKRSSEEINYEQLRGMTDRVMRAISLLVDHSKGFVPMTIPIQTKETPDRIPETPFKNKPGDGKAKVGVLVLHGFTSHVSCVADLRFPLDELGLPYRIPILRGHGGQWEDLQNVKAADWYEDAENSLLDLLSECRKVIVVGLSMGGLVALDLAAHHRKTVVGVATLAAAIKFKDPLAPLSGAMSKVIKSWPSPNAYVDRELRKQRNRNYPKFPTAAFASLYEYSRQVENNLSFIAANTLVLWADKDEIVHPKAAHTIYDKVSTKNKRITCIEGSGHEMLLDREAPKATHEVVAFIKELTKQQGVLDEREESEGR